MQNRCAEEKRMRCHGFVQDGCSRARAALEPNIRAEVTLEFEPRLRAASPDVRHALQREMKREIARRLDKKAPQNALY
jgi:hypothetical protein